ncbi:MAG: putative polysaccharide biosynthesis protein [Alphaproteobacteria bacterium]|jgi:spore coat polysaccharide biosynthesis predicted glycosyltransferase SpsG|nr:putative polysaccharide biosynthesis protein [Alphaproteobacteria bacterium]
MTQKKAFFRLEASPIIGAGHAMRCRVVADALSEMGWICHFVTSQEAYNFIPTLSRFERVEPDKFYESPGAVDLLVVDHYNLDASYESHFRSYAQTIMVIDDLADRPHDCDILLNQNFGFTALDYQGFVSEQCKIILGIEHCIVDPFYYEDSMKRECFKNILFYMGGSGDIKHIYNVAVECSEKYHVGFVEGFAHNFKEMGQGAFEVCFSANQIKQAYHWSDISIGFAGQGMFERYVMGIPMIVFSQNEMQHSVLRRLQDKNIIYCGDIKNISFQLISQKINEITKSYQYNKCIPKLDFLNYLPK